MRYILHFEKFSLDEKDIKQTILNLKIRKDLKDAALGLLKQYTNAGKGKITGLNLHPIC